MLNPERRHLQGVASHWRARYRLNQVLCKLSSWKLGVEMFPLKMSNAVFHSLGPMHHGKAISALKMDFTVDPRCILWFCSHFEVLKSRACISPCWLSWRRPREERGQHCSRHSRGHTERNQKKRDFAALIISDILQPHQWRGKHTVQDTCCRVSKGT